MNDKKSEVMPFFSHDNVPHYSMEADLGLFNQLLQMVDGDWSDSIKGICNHLQQRFCALGVVLSILDKRFDEFIYISDSFSEDVIDILKKNSITIESDTSIERMHRLYRGTDSFLEKNVFYNDTLINLATIYFEGDMGTAGKVVKEMNLETIIALPALEENKNYKCFFHIGTDRCFDKKTIEEITGYSNQLNIALEIVFLVRDLYIKATHDSLTRLFNHKQGDILLQKEMDRVERNSLPLTIAMLDLDFFKKINDTYGHTAGDEVLITISKVLTGQLRKCDIVSRYGGEEFLVILPDTEIKNAISVLNRVKQTIENTRFKFNGKDFGVTASFGLSQYDTERHHDKCSFINDADRRLYAAKSHGRNRMEF